MTQKLDPAIKLQRLEERLCECGAAGSGECHADECPAKKFDHSRNKTAVKALAAMSEVAHITRERGEGES